MSGLRLSSNSKLLIYIKRRFCIDTIKNTNKNESDRIYHEIVKQDSGALLQTSCNIVARTLQMIRGKDSFETAKFACYLQKWNLEPKEATIMALCKLFAEKKSVSLTKQLNEYARRHQLLSEDVYIEIIKAYISLKEFKLASTVFDEFMRSFSKSSNKNKNMEALQQMCVALVIAGQIEQAASLVETYYRDSQFIMALLHALIKADAVSFAMDTWLLYLKKGLPVDAPLLEVACHLQALQKQPDIDSVLFLLQKAVDNDILITSEMYKWTAACMLAAGAIDHVIPFLQKASNSRCTFSLKEWCKLISFCSSSAIVLKMLDWIKMSPSLLHLLSNSLLSAAVQRIISTDNDISILGRVLQIAVDRKHVSKDHAACVEALASECSQNQGIGLHNLMLNPTHVCLVVATVISDRKNPAESDFLQLLNSLQRTLQHQLIVECWRLIPEIQCSAECLLVASGAAMRARRPVASLRIVDDFVALKDFNVRYQCMFVFATYNQLMHGRLREARALYDLYERFGKFSKPDWFKTHEGYLLTWMLLEAFVYEAIQLQDQRNLTTEGIMLVADSTIWFIESIFINIFAQNIADSHEKLKALTSNKQLVKRYVNMNSHYVAEQLHLVQPSAIDDALGILSRAAMKEMLTDGLKQKLTHDMSLIGAAKHGDVNSSKSQYLQKSEIIAAAISQLHNFSLKADLLT